MTQRILFFCLILFSTQLINAQEFDPRIEKNTLNIDGQAREGYLTRFDASAKKIEKAWWSYCRAFGRPLNMKGYYRVTIPKELNEGTIDLVLLSQTMSSKNGSSFFLSLSEEGIPKDKLREYLAQVEVILQTFKINYTVDLLEADLQNLEIKAARESKKVNKSSGTSKNKHLTQLQQLESEIELVKRKLLEINQAY